jgi:hypothetical protein
MRGAVGLVAAMALLAACQRVEAPTPAPSPTAIATASEGPAGPAQPAPTTLAGEWRVAGIDGAPFDEPYGLALSADARLVWMEPRCAGVARSYRIGGGRIAFGPDPDARNEVCAIGMPPRTDDVLRALDAAERIRRTPANGIEIAGGGHSLTLFSQ